MTTRSRDDGGLRHAALRVIRHPPPTVSGQSRTPAGAAPRHGLRRRAARGGGVGGAPGRLAGRLEGAGQLARLAIALGEGGCTMYTMRASNY